jgi:aspartate kinase
MEKMKIFKFGGKALESLRSFVQVRKIVEKERPQVIVVSAIGKTTNALEDFVKGCRSNDKNLMEDALGRILGINGSIIKEISLPWLWCRPQKTIDFLKEFASRRKEFNSWEIISDRIAIEGELLAADILCQFLDLNRIMATIIRADSFIKTDLNFNCANFLEEQSLRKFPGNEFKSCLEEGEIIIIHGFIASATVDTPFLKFDGATTLGREGSDYTAALIAFLLTELEIAEVESVTLWKDVPGVADRNPKEKSKDPVHYFSSLSYTKCGEEIQPGGIAEGLIHPKTVEVLKKLGIPLWIKSFWKPNLRGTFVGNPGLID